MDAVFNQLTQAGKNNDKDLFNLVKSSNIIDGQKVTEGAVQQMFNALPNKSNIPLSGFTGIVGQISSLSGQSQDGIMGKIIQAAQAMLGQAAAGGIASKAAGALGGLFGKK